MGWFRSTTAAPRGAATSWEARLAQISPGVPGRCPACEGLGYIDSIDIGHRYQIQHCKDCQHRWEYLFDAEGTVVGLTELDRDGHPVSRSRVRPLQAEAAPATPPPVAEPPAPEPPAPDVVIDLRDAPPAPTGHTPAPDGDEADQLSPAEWLRRSLHR